MHLLTEVSHEMCQTLSKKALKYKIGTAVSGPEDDEMIYACGFCDRTDRGFYCEGHGRKRSPWASKRLTQRQRRWESVWQ